MAILAVVVASSKLEERKPLSSSSSYYEIKKKGTATRKGIKITLNLRLLLCLFLFSYPTEYESCAVFVQVLSKENATVLKNLADLVLKRPSP